MVGWIYRQIQGGEDRQADHGTVDIQTDSWWGGQVDRHTLGRGDRQTHHGRVDIQTHHGRVDRQTHHGRVDRQTDSSW